MKLESHTINITLSFSDSVGAREINLDLTCTNLEERVFSSIFSSMPEGAFSRELVTAYNSAMRELSGHYPTFTFLTI